MAMFLRMKSTRIAFQRGMSSPLVNAEQGSKCSLGGPFLRTITERERWRRCRDGAPFSSWGGEGWDQPSQKSRAARWADRIALGLAALMIGVFWTSRHLKDDGDAYNAPQYSEKEKLQRETNVLLAKINREMNRRRMARIKLYANEQEYSRQVQLLVNKFKMKRWLYALEQVVEHLEDALCQKMEKAEGRTVPDVAQNLLRRMEELKRVLSASSSTDGPINPEQRAELARELSEAKATVMLILEEYEETEAFIMHNREVKAEMDDMLRELEKKR